MKKTVLALCLMSCSVLPFATAHAAEDVVIGFVDATKVFEQSPQYEAARKALEAEFTRRDSDLVAQQKELKKLEEKLARDGTVMSDSEVKALERDIMSERRKLKNDQDEFREDFNLRRNEEFNKLRRQVAEVVREVGKEDGVDIIFSDGVVYASERVNISEKILQRLRDKFKASQPK